ncbi:MAG: alpha/beta hydrolase, partial [Mariprofundaceae bacterium]|nr:alpha/beta hydrolase [Mariprofundaceae bacterium]
KTGAQRQADLVKMMLVNPILTLQQKAPMLQADTSTETRVMHLPSGRTISYAEYGNPKGMPILFCHAITGCRMMMPVASVNSGKAGFRLIVPDRAGYGLTSPAQSDPMQQWLEDMRHFLPQLGISKCCIAGHSAGGAYAMAMAVEFPDIVNHLCLISSVAPLRNLQDADYLLPVSRMVVHLARNNPEAARAFLKLSMQTALKEPDSYLRLITNSSPDLDKEVLGNAGLKQHLLDAFRETSRQGVGHMVDELMYISTRWKVDPAKIPCPVSIWHGMEDKHAPFPLVRHFHARLKQVVHTSWMEGAGHYMLFHHWSAIEKQLCTKKKGKSGANTLALLAWASSLLFGKHL